MAISDMIVITLGFLSAFWFVFSSGFHVTSRPYPIYFIPSIILITIIFLVIFQLEGLYKYQAITNPIHQLQSLIKSYLKALATFILIVFFMKTEYIADSRLTIGLGFLISFILIIINRNLIVPRVFYHFVKRGIIKKRAIIVGAGEHGRMVFLYLRDNPRRYFDIVGFCDDDPQKIGTMVCGKLVLGSSNDLKVLIVKHAIKEIIIAISNIKKDNLIALIDRCKEANVVIHVVSDLFAQVNDKMEAEEFGGLITYRITPNLNGIVRHSAKRLMDLAVSITLLVIFSPLFLLIAWLIKRDSDGPAFYKAEVIGKGGQPFTAFKFRSMISNETNNPQTQKQYEEAKKRHIAFMKDFIQGNIRDSCFVANESRITRVGRFLRKYSLDELPQFINVLRGEMSLVGPRFCSDTEYSFYKSWHKRRFQIKPGMTGLWQVRARSAVNYDDMVMLDLYYIQNWSLLFDLEILLRTVSTVFLGQGSRVGDEPQTSKFKEFAAKLKNDG